MNKIVIGQGETETIRVTDSEGYSVSLLVSADSSTAPIIEKNSLFADGSADIELVHEDTNIEVGEYVYQIRIYDEEGEYFNIRPSGCVDGDCTFAEFVICASIPEES